MLTALFEAAVVTVPALMEPCLACSFNCRTGADDYKCCLPIKSPRFIPMPTETVLVAIDPVVHIPRSVRCATKEASSSVLQRSDYALVTCFSWVSWSVVSQVT